MSADLPSRPFAAELQLDEEQRQSLGLSANEALRPLRTTARTITLERTRRDSISALPWDRELVLSADVQSFPLADLLSLLHETQKSGFLSFSWEQVEKALYLRRGEVIFAASNQECDRLGETLMRAGAVTIEQLRDTEERFSPSRPTPFGKVMIERGLITPRQLWQGVKHQVEEIARSLFAYTAGSIHFWEGAVDPDNAVRLSLPTRRLIAEGLERRDELLRFVAHLDDSRVSLRRVDGAVESLSGNGRAVYLALEDGDGFPVLCRRAGFDPLSTARTLQLLKLVGAVEIEVGWPEDAMLVDGERTSLEDEQIRARVLDYTKLLSELVAPLVALEGETQLRTRIEELLADVARSHPALFHGIELGAGCVLDPEALSARALRLTGSREAAVTAALGELVSYVEFELKNHPAIDDPEAFLDAVEELRARVEL